jgi:iron complex transport system substrate-binding protein
MTVLRVFTAFVFALFIAAAPASARSVTDSAGRVVEVPDHVARVFAAGPPAAALLYVLAPQDMIGWVKAPDDAAKAYLLPAVRDLPELGRLTGKGGKPDLDKLKAARADLIIDFGTIAPSYKTLADQVQAERHIPYLLIDGSLQNTPAALRLLAEVLGVKDRGEALAQAAEARLAEVGQVLAKVPATARPHVYLARRADGLQSGAHGSITNEIITLVGGTDVVPALLGKGGLVVVSVNDLVQWAPDTIITLEHGFAAKVATAPDWQPVPAVAEHRVFVAPALPFGFIDEPPSVNRLIGLPWLLHTLYPAQATGDLKQQVRNFYHLFYQVDLDDAALDRLLAGP